MSHKEAVSKIVAAKIIRELSENTMMVTIANAEGTEIKELFTYYPDEIDFTPDELYGLTEDEAHALYTKKTKHYLQS